MREMEAFANLRAANESKLLPTAECMDLRVCVCQKAPMGAMLQCELCRDAFHSVCVRGLSDSCEAWPWLCPHCRRSGKPPLSNALALLASLQHTGVRLPEGEALQHLVERTLGWQQRMQEMLLSYNLPELEERPATPPTLTCWASGSHISHNDTQVGPRLGWRSLSGVGGGARSRFVLFPGPVFDTRVDPDRPRSDGVLHRAEVHPAAGSVPL